MLRRLVTGTFLNGIALVLAMAATLALTPFVIQTLGKDAYGTWVLVSSFSILSGYFSLFDLGIQSSVVKFVAEHYVRREFRALNEVVSAALMAYGVLGLLGGVILAVFAHFFLTRTFNIPVEQIGPTRTLLYIMAVQTALEFPSLAITGILGGLQRYDLERLVEIVRLAFYVAAVVGFLSAGYGVVSLGLVVFVLTLLRSMVYMFIVIRLLPEWRLMWSIPRSTILRITAFSSKLLLIRINAVIYNQMDKAIIAAVLISTALTDYDIASKVHALAIATLTLTSSLMVPAASALGAVDDTPRLKRLMIRGSKYTAALCVPTVLVAMLLAEPLLRFWIGPEYAYNAGITRLFLAYLLFWSLTPVGMNMMIGLNQTLPLVRIQVITTVVNLGVSIVLTPRIGVAGVIWGTLIGNGLAFFPLMHLFLYKLGLPLRDFMRWAVLGVYPQAILSAAVLAGTVYVRPPQDLVEVAIYGAGCMVLYGVLFGASGLDAYERQLAASAGRRVALSGLMDRFMIH